MLDRNRRLNDQIRAGTDSIGDETLMTIKDNYQGLGIGNTQNVMGVSPFDGVLDAIRSARDAANDGKPEPVEFTDLLERHGVSPFFRKGWP